MVLREFFTFECNDSPYCPLFIRESILEVLGKSIRDAKVYEKLAPHFSQFCQKVGVQQIVEFGAGSGESTAIFVDALVQTKQVPPHIYISDLYPMVEVMAQTSRSYPGLITPITEPADIRNPEAVPAHDMRMVLSAFHHFDGDLVRVFLQKARDQGVAVFIAEPFTRSLKAFFPLFLHGFTSLARNGLFSSRRRLLKFFFTFLLPVIPMGLLWDGLVSMLRMYDGDLLGIAGSLQGNSADYEWQYVEVPVPLGGTASVFTGQPILKSVRPGFGGDSYP